MVLEIGTLLLGEMPLGQARRPKTEELFRSSRCWPQQIPDSGQAGFEWNSVRGLAAAALKEMAREP